MLTPQSEQYSVYSNTSQNLHQPVFKAIGIIVWTFENLALFLFTHIYGKGRDLKNIEAHKLQIFFSIFCSRKKLKTLHHIVIFAVLRPNLHYRQLIQILYDWRIMNS